MEEWLDRNAVAGRVTGIAFTLLRYDPDDGIYLLNGEPFTGVALTWWPDGQLSSVVHLQDGMTHGISVGWHFNGRPAVYNEMEHDVVHGLHIEWAEDGSVSEEFRCHHGRRIKAAS